MFESTAQSRQENSAEFKKLIRGAKPDRSFEIEEKQKQYLCYLDNGYLLILAKHQNSALVQNYIKRLERQERQPKKRYVTPQQLAEAWELESTVISTDMQRRADELFHRATDAKASDIHIRAEKNLGTEILFRIDGNLNKIEDLTYEEGEKIIKVLYQHLASTADPTHEITQRQNARVTEKLPAGLDGVRIATTPTVDGMLMVLRLLYNSTNNSLDPRDLGFSDEQAQMLEILKRKPYGIVVVCGPTGSGKSTTLQRVLSSIIVKTEGKKHIITVEDPPEYPIEGATQTPITNANTDEERAKAFNEAISATMRLDPDTIMIGEIRNEPSANLAIQAAMTGHTVWTTLHANTAMGVFSRLTNLGVQMDLLCDPDILTGIIAQRLVRKLCSYCKVSFVEKTQKNPTAYSQEDQYRIAKIVTNIESVYVKGPGCIHCKNTGTDGRTVIAEIVVTDYKLLEMIRQKKIHDAISYWHEKGGFTMAEHAIRKIRNGEIDPFMAEEDIRHFDDLNLNLIS